MLNIVVIKFIAPKIEDAPAMCKLKELLNPLQDQVDQLLKIMEDGVSNHPTPVLTWWTLNKN